MRTREELENIGCRILGEMRTELYLSLRAMGPALDALSFRLDLSTRTIGTDAESIRFNPTHVLQLFLNRPRRLLRTYMHMLLHCLLRHPFQKKKWDDPELYDLCADISVELLLDTSGGAAGDHGGTAVPLFYRAAAGYTPSGKAGPGIHTGRSQFLGAHE